MTEEKRRMEFTKHAIVFSGDLLKCADFHASLNVEHQVNAAQLHLRTVKHFIWRCKFKIKEKHWQALSWVTRKSNKLSSDAVALDGEKNARCLGKRRYFCPPDRLREDGEVAVKSIEFIRKQHKIVDIK